MNILFVHEIDWLNKVVFEVHTLSEFLSLLGHRVYAIDYENMWVKNGFFDFGSLETRVFSGVARAYPEASVCLRRPGFIKIPGLSRLSAAFTHYIEIQKAIKEKDIDVVVLYSVPTNGLQTVHLGKKFRIPVVFRSIDILNQLVLIPPLRPITRLLETKVYHSVDLILTLSPKLSEYVLSSGAQEDKVRLLPLGVDTRLFHPFFDSTEIQRKWGIKDDDNVVLFIGTLFEFSGLDSFIQRFPRITEQVPTTKLLIVGDGPQRLKLEKIIGELDLTKQVIITGFEPYETMPQYINLASICINPFLITEATREIFPGKIVQYLACGRGVVATPLPGMRALLPPKGCGLVYAEDIHEMVEEVISLLKSPKYLQQLGEEGLKYARQVHSYDKIARKFENILEEAIKEKHNGSVCRGI